MNAQHKSNNETNIALFAQLMDECHCKRCSQYTTGCKPYQVIECTKYFINKLKVMPLNERRKNHAID
jgi:hypothetical protein